MYLYGGNFTQVHTSNLLTLSIFNEYTQVLITRFNRMLFFFYINLPRSTEIFCSVNVSASKYLPPQNRQKHFFSGYHIFPYIINNLNVFFFFTSKECD